MFFSNVFPYRQDKTSLARSKPCSRASTTSKLTNNSLSQKNKVWTFDWCWNDAVNMFHWISSNKMKKWVNNFWQTHKFILSEPDYVISNIDFRINQKAWYLNVLIELKAGIIMSRSSNIPSVDNHSNIRWCIAKIVSAWTLNSFLRSDS